MLLDTVHSYNAGVILHTQTPTRSNLALIVGAGGDELGEARREGKLRDPIRSLWILGMQNTNSLNRL